MIEEGGTIAVLLLCWQHQRMGGWMADEDWGPPNNPKRTTGRSSTMKRNYNFEINLNLLRKRMTDLQQVGA